MLFSWIVQSQQTAISFTTPRSTRLGLLYPICVACLRSFIRTRVSLVLSLQPFFAFGWVFAARRPPQLISFGSQLLAFSVHHSVLLLPSRPKSWSRPCCQLPKHIILILSGERLVLSCLFWSYTRHGNKSFIATLLQVIVTMTVQWAYNSIIML